MKFNKQLINIFTILFWLNLVNAQEEFIKFSQLSNEAGLSSSAVKSITQDYDGFIWIATIDGLNRYDGYEFKVFRKSSGNRNTLTKNDINIVGAGNKGFIWAGSSEGVDRLNTRTEVFEHYKHIDGDSSTISFSNVSAIIKDEVIETNGMHHVWLGTSMGLNRFDPTIKKFYYYYNDTENEKSISHNNITTLYIAKNNDLWIGTKNGLNQYDQKSDSFIRYIENDTNEFSINGNEILSITEDKYQNIWISTASGINIYNQKTKQFSNGNNNPELFFFNFPSIQAKVLLTDKQEQVWMGSEDEGLFRYDYSLESFKNFQEQELLSNTLASNQILTMFEDNSGIIWVGTNGNGINKLRYSKEMHFRHVRKDPNLESTIIDNNVAAIYQDNFNNIWYGTFDKGLSKYNTSSETFSDYQVGSDETSLSGNSIHDIIEDNSGNLWIATNNGLNRYLGSDDVFERIDSEILGGYSVFSLFLDKTNILWIGTDNGVSKYNYTSKSYQKFLHNLNDSNSISDNYVISFAEDNAGKLWIGTVNGLNSFDQSKKEFKRYLTDIDDNSTISDNYIYSIHNDLQGNIWIGTKNGLNKFISETGKFKRFGTEDGLPNSIIYGIQEDNQNNLWLSSNYGLSKYNYIENSFRNYDIRDGIQGNEFNQYSYFKNTTGVMFFGGLNGVTQFDPEKIIVNENIPKIAFTDIKVNFQTISLEDGFFVDKIELPYTQNSLSFEVAALEFTIPEKNRYLFKLEGYDNDWIQSGTRNFKSYTNLDPDDYEFKIRVANNDGVLSEERVVLSIVIIPPFWQTLWFQIFAFILVISGIYALFYLQKRSAKKRQDILEAEVAKRTVDLESAVLELNEENENRMQAERKLRLAQSESNAILENVNEGLFLLNEEFEISEQHSKELEVIFDQKNLSKFNFLSLMQNLITKKNMDSLKKYLEVQFNKNIDEDVFKNLNPLESVEVHMDAKNAEYVSKYLKFSFSRVMDGDTIFSLLIAVQDITKVVQLQIQLDETQKKQRQEIDQLLSILKVDPVELREYIESVEVTLEKITTSFKEDDQDYSVLLSDVFKKVHNLKGNAGFLDMKFFVDKFHSIEETVKNLQEQETLSGNDFLHILFEMNKIRKYIISMNQLIDRVLDMSKQITRSVSSEEKRDILVSGFSKRVKQLNTELGKKAKFVFENTNNLMIPDKYETAFKDIIIHLINNSMVHGVEKIAERKKNNKKPEALLKVEINQSNGKFGFKFRDDGKGLNLDELKKKAIKSGRFTEADIKKMSEVEITDLVFQDGISTAEIVDENAGRGQGMSIIKDIVNEVNGNVELTTKFGEFFEADIFLPL